MNRNCRWKTVAVGLLVPALAYGAEGIAAADAFAPNGDAHYRFASDAPLRVTVCDVTLLNVLSNVDLYGNSIYKLLLKANCGTSLTSINWLRNGISIKGEIYMSPSATGDVYFYASGSTTVSNKIHIFTAVGNRGAIPAGESAVFLVEN